MLIDSNILIYALNASSPKHFQAQKFIESHQTNLIVTQQNIFETLRILTHIKFPKPFTQNKAILALENIFNHAVVLNPTYETTSITFELIKKYRIGGSEIFDAYLVATALSHNVRTIATDNNKHLKKYVEITVINPFK